MKIYSRLAYQTSKEFQYMQQAMVNFAPLLKTHTCTSLMINNDKNVQWRIHCGISHYIPCQFFGSSVYKFITLFKKKIFVICEFVFLRHQFKKKICLYIWTAGDFSANTENQYNVRHKFCYMLYLYIRLQFKWLYFPMLWNEALVLIGYLSIYVT